MRLFVKLQAAPDIMAAVCCLLHHLVFLSSTCQAHLPTKSAASDAVPQTELKLMLEDLSAPEVKPIAREVSQGLLLQGAQRSG